MDEGALLSRNLNGDATALRTITGQSLTTSDEWTTWWRESNR
jgi:hypothetical protein